MEPSDISKKKTFTISCNSCGVPCERIVNDSDTVCFPCQRLRARDCAYLRKHGLRIMPNDGKTEAQRALRKAEIQKIIEESRQLRAEKSRLRVERSEQVLNLRKEGWSFQKIGKIFGISHERARQILAKFPPELIPKREIKCPSFMTTCTVCGIAVRRGYRTKSGRYFCSRKCSGKERRIYATPEEKKKAKHERDKRRYRENPEVRRKHKIHVAHAHARRKVRMSRDPEYRELVIRRQKESEARFHAKRKAARMNTLHPLSTDAKNQERDIL